jgi:hypothetical protein
LAGPAEEAAQVHVVVKKGAFEKGSNDGINSHGVFDMSADS